MVFTLSITSDATLTPLAVFETSVWGADKMYAGYAAGVENFLVALFNTYVNR